MSKKGLLVLFFSFTLGPSAYAEAPRVSLQTTQGRIVVELSALPAVKTIENFLAYVRDGFYDDTIFHRVIDGFMIQGGGFGRDLRQKETRAPVEHEGAACLPNKTGTIAMARTADPQSATAQFFFNVADNGFLDFRGPTPRGFGYCAFGTVVEGMDVVMKIAKVRTGPGGPFQSDLPKSEIAIEKAVVIPQIN